MKKISLTRLSILISTSRFPIFRDNFILLYGHTDNVQGGYNPCYVSTIENSFKLRHNMVYYETSEY